jgi:hypothetical protein
MIKRLRPRNDDNPDNQTPRDVNPNPEEPSLLPGALPEPFPADYSDLITQAELRYYLSLVETSRQCGELRGRLVARLEGGAQVEPGELEPFMITDSQLTCSWKCLEEALGKKKTSRIKRLVKETEYRRLRIRDSQGTILGWGSKRQSGSADP